MGVSRRKIQPRSAQPQLSACLSQMEISEGLQKKKKVLKMNGFPAPVVLFQRPLWDFGYEIFRDGPAWPGQSHTEEHMNSYKVWPALG